MIGALFTFAIYLLILCVLWFLFDYIIRTVPVPDPPARIVRIVLVVLFCLILIGLLLDLIGISSGINFPKLGKLP